MIDTLIKELDTEMTEAETNEKLNQEDYEEMMADSAAKRAADSKSLAQREGAKADTERALVDAESAKWPSFAGPSTLMSLWLTALPSTQPPWSLIWSMAIAIAYGVDK